MSYRNYYFMCPIGPQVVPDAPDVRTQIEQALAYRPAWRPPSECQFVLRPLAEGEERPQLEGAYRNHNWRDPWRSEYIYSSANNARTLAQHYRCAEHNLPPRVFRQHHAYSVHSGERPQMRRWDRVFTSPDTIVCDIRAPWPSDIETRVRGVNIWVPRRPTPRTTHEVWPV